MIQHIKSFKNDFMHEDTWRVFRIMSEFIEGFETLSKIGKAVCVFGSSRIKSTDKYYKLTEKTAHLLAKSGYKVITGGGPAIMEAANKGACRVKNHSIGLNIEIPTEQKPNKYIETLLDFHYFFVRKVMFVKYTKAFVIMPGGYGTLDELFEGLNLIQTKRIGKFPIILMGSEYWKGLIDWLKATVIKNGCINQKEFNIFHVVDKPGEVVSIIKKFYTTRKS